MPDVNEPQGRKHRRLHRRIVERIVVTGKLRLETPAHFGNGETEALTDMPLLLDELDGSPLLPGTSIAGALRNYLRECELGYWAKPPAPPKYEDEMSELQRYEVRQSYLKEQGQATTLLFGGSRGDDEGGQSPLIVRDAPGQATDYELRDGVRIEPETRAAEDEKKYDITLLAAGSTFDIRFELLIGFPHPEDRDALDECRLLLGLPYEAAITFDQYRAALINALATALDGLAKGEITLGARKRRGFGRCRVDEWTVRRYDLKTRAGLLACLAEDRDGWAEPVTANAHADIRQALGAEVALLADARQRFTISADFSLDGSLMVRAGLADSGPDMVHLHSPRPNQDGGMVLRPILAGTSWAGALRSRATQIAYTLAPGEKGKELNNKVERLIDGIFGPAEIESRTKKGRSDSESLSEEEKAKRAAEREPKASRIEVAETEIDPRKVKQLEQTRIKIDRFTGGAFESALFSERPLFGSKDQCLRLELSLRLPAELSRDRQQAEIGLLLLLLKDLWTGDLPLGGEVGIGRGRLRGAAARINYDGYKRGEWELSQADDGSVAVTKGDRAALQSFVEVLNEELRYD